jgi:hypothetical protein
VLLKKVSKVSILTYKLSQDNNEVTQSEVLVPLYQRSSVQSFDLGTSSFVSQTKRDSTQKFQVPGPGLYNLEASQMTNRSAQRPGFGSTEAKKGPFIDTTHSKGVG